MHLSTLSGSAVSYSIHIVLCHAVLMLHPCFASLSFDMQWRLLIY